MWLTPLAVFLGGPQNGPRQVTQPYTNLQASSASFIRGPIWIIWMKFPQHHLLQYVFHQAAATWMQHGLAPLHKYQASTRVCSISSCCQFSASCYRCDAAISTFATPVVIISDIVPLDYLFHYSPPAAEHRGNLHHNP